MKFREERIRYKGVNERIGNIRKKRSNKVQRRDKEVSTRMLS